MILIESKNIFEYLLSSFAIDESDRPVFIEIYDYSSEYWNYLRTPGHWPRFDRSFMSSNECHAD